MAVTLHGFCLITITETGTGTMAVMAHDLGDTGMLTPEEYEQVIEERCQAWLGIDLAEFKRLLRDAELPNTPAVGHILMLLGVGA